jgi:hypothetical protein
LQGRRLGFHQGNQGDVAGAWDPDPWEWDEEATGGQIGLKDRQGAYAEAKAVDHGLESYEEMVEDTPALFGAVRQAGGFQPIRPVTGSGLAGQQDVVRDVSRLTQGDAIEQGRARNQRVGFRQERHCLVLRPGFPLG